MSKDTPNPGSDEAIDEGCNCPILDNNRGEGYRYASNTFVINITCPVHGEQ